MISSCSVISIGLLVVLSVLSHNKAQCDNRLKPNVLIDAIADLNLVKPSFFEKSFALTQFSMDEKLLNTMIDKFASLCETQLSQLEETTNKDDLVRLVHIIK